MNHWELVGSVALEHLADLDREAAREALATRIQPAGPARPGEQEGHLTRPWHLGLWASRGLHAFGALFHVRPAVHHH